MEVTITLESPASDEGRLIVSELEDEIGPMYPSESQHGYSVEKLIAERVAFFLVRVDGQVAGCGGVQLHGTDYGELKRMYVRPAFRGMGLARRLVDRLAEHARVNGVTNLRLETGIHQDSAIGLYERMGFMKVPPFPPYQLDPLSVFYERRG